MNAEPMERASLWSAFAVGQKTTETLQGDDLNLFNQLIAEFKTIPDPPRNPKAAALAQEISEKAKNGNNQITVNDLDSLEYAVLILTPIDRLRREAWSKRDRFRRVAGPQMFERYCQAKMPNAETADEASLRADLEQVVSETHRIRNLEPAIARRRTKVAYDVGKITLWIVGISLVIYLANLYAPSEWRPAFTPNSGPGLLGMLVLSALFGALGGFVSLMRRIYGATAPNTAGINPGLINIQELDSGVFSLLLSPVYGAVFAILLSFLFMSGILQGSLFPAFENANGASSHFTLLSVKPSSLSGLFSLMVWSFIAGFAETLVPDMLNRLIAQARTTAEAGNPALPANPNDQTSASKIQLLPKSVELLPKATQTFSLTGADKKDVTWQIKEDSGGAITDDGVYTAPETPGEYHVIAKSASGTWQDKDARILVKAATSDFTISVTPITITANVGDEPEPVIVTVTPSPDFMTPIALTTESPFGRPTVIITSPQPPPAAGTAVVYTLTIDALSLTAGDYPIKVVGTAGGEVETTTITLTLTAS